MLFETTVCTFLGKKGNHIESTESRTRPAYLKKCLKRILKMINELDTPLPHKEDLMRQAEGAFREITRSSNPSWQLVYYLFRLVGTLFGYTNQSGKPFVTLAYYQTHSQYYQWVYSKPNTAFRTTEDRESALSLRRKLALQLKTEGIETFMIALVLHTSEYEVKKLCSVAL